MRQTLDEEVIGLTRVITEPEIAVFGPANERHFIPVEWVPIVAYFVLEAFFKGFTAGAQEGIENLGKTTGKWLVEAMTKLFQKGAQAFSDWKADLEASKQRAAAAIGAADIERIADEVQAGIFDTLTERGVLPSKAARIGEEARAAAIRQMES